MRLEEMISWVQLGSVSEVGMRTNQGRTTPLNMVAMLICLWIASVTQAVCAEPGAMAQSARGDTATGPSAGLANRKRPTAPMHLSFTIAKGKIGSARENGARTGWFGIALPTRRMLLKGTVTHSRTLSPLPTRLRPGHTLSLPTDVGTLDSCSFTRVPNLLAGTWREFSFKALSLTDVRTRKSLPMTPQRGVPRSHMIIGEQMDRHGNVWGFDYPAFYHEVQPRDYREVTLYEDAETVSLTDKSFVRRVESRYVDMEDPRNPNRITRAGQRENFRTYTLLSPTRLRVDSTEEEFDMEGRILPLIAPRSKKTARVPASYADFWFSRSKTHIRTIAPTGSPSLFASA